MSQVILRGLVTDRINLLFAPSFEAVENLNTALEARGVNLKSDGRPIFKITCEDLVKLCKEVDPRIEIIPAHAWTPHFGVFGSLSGFDSLEEAFGSQAKYIFAFETGLSSDPKMNWQVSSMDNYALISNSDAHSLRKLGREANVFDIPENDLSYDAVITVLKNRNPKEFLYTIEFFPEEGKYHLDGHADCKFSCLPKETRRLGGICPKCGKKLLRGVTNRVEMLGDRDYGFTPKSAIPYKNIIPLEEVIAASLGVGTSSKKVALEYERMVAQFSEYEILLDLPKEEIARISSEIISESVDRVRRHEVIIEPGYDGVFGKITFYDEKEPGRLLVRPKQIGLF